MSAIIPPGAGECTVLAEILAGNEPWVGGLPTLSAPFNDRKAFALSQSVDVFTNINTATLQDWTAYGNEFIPIAPSCERRMNLLMSLHASGADITLAAGSQMIAEAFLGSSTPGVGPVSLGQRVINLPLGSPFGPFMESWVFDVKTTHSYITMRFASSASGIARVTLVGYSMGA